jgi:hypothetical protein
VEGYDGISDLGESLARGETLLLEHTECGSIRKALFIRQNATSAIDYLAILDLPRHELYFGTQCAVEFSEPAACGEFADLLSDEAQECLNPIGRRFTNAEKDE